MPGTPAESPLKRAGSNASGLPFSMNESGFIARGAFSRPSIVVTSPSAVRMTMKPPPPMPHENGSVTPSTPAAATAASTALPPAFERVDRRLGAERVDGGGRAAGAARRRLLRRLLRAGALRADQDGEEPGAHQRQAEWVTSHRASPAND